ncbi:MAG: N-terminal acetyltransferase ARD1 [Amphiamblys sp. WSBS2006]|nr:MAG: N-terminal acetyltransferase ARD1 [Amphiamblys sp. WSBS2006]
MVTIRQLRVSDLVGVQRCNAANLPENYAHRFYAAVAFQPTGLSFVACDQRGSVVGYVLGRMDGETAYVVSIAVGREWRGVGLAQQLLVLCERGGLQRGAKDMRLNVRVSNEAALCLYRKHGYGVLETERAYYSDKEASYVMQKVFS